MDKNSQDDTDDVVERRREVIIYSVEEIVNHLGCGFFQAFLFIFCAIWTVVESSEIMMLSLLLPTLRNYWDLSPIEESILGSVTFAGLFVGNLLFGWFSDRFGRLYAIYVGVFSTSLFGIISVFCSEYYLFLIVRFVVGICQGSVGVVFTLLTEYLPKRGRGLYLVTVTGSWACASVFEALLGWLVLPRMGENAWQFYVGFSLLPILLSLPMLIFLPESVRFLSILRSNNIEEKNKKQRRIKKIVGVMERMNFKKLPHNRNLVQGYSVDFEVKIVEPGEYRTNFFAELASKPILLFMFVNVCVYGSLASFVYYCLIMMIPDIFDNSQSYKTGHYFYQGTLLNSVVELPSILVLILAYFFFDRRTAQIILYVIGGLSVGGLFFNIQGKIAVLGFTLIARCFVDAATTSCWVIVHESFPTNIRSRSFHYQYAIGKLFTIFTPFYSKMLGPKDWWISFGILAVMCFVGAFSTYLHPFETKMKDLEESHQIQRNGKLILNDPNDLHVDEQNIPLLVEKKLTPFLDDKEN